MRLNELFIFPPSFPANVYVPSITCKHCNNKIKLDRGIEDACTTQEEAQVVLNNWASKHKENLGIYKLGIEEGTLRTQIRFLFVGMLLIFTGFQSVFIILSPEDYPRKDIKVIGLLLIICLWNLFGHPRKTLSYWSITISILSFVLFYLIYSRLH